MDRMSRGAEVGERVARERERQRISRSAFSRKVTHHARGARGTSRTALRNLEEGRVDSPSKEVIEAIATVLEVEERWLWTGKPPRFRSSADAGDWTAARPTPRGPGLTPDRATAAFATPRVPRDHSAWGPGIARTIAAECLLATASPPVRARFWSILEAAADRTYTAVSGPDDLLRLARHIDGAVRRPLRLLRPGQPPEGPWFEEYALTLLDRFARALDGEATAPGTGIGNLAVAREPDMPPSVRSSRTTSRRERGGLTWRLM